MLLHSDHFCLPGPFRTPNLSSVVFAVLSALCHLEMTSNIFTYVTRSLMGTWQRPEPTSAATGSLINTLGAMDLLVEKSPNWMVTFRPLLYLSHKDITHSAI